MNNSREKFEEALNNCVLETQCMLEYDEFITRDIAHFIWQAATEQSKKEIEILLNQQERLIALVDEKDARIAELEARLNVDFPLLVKLFDNIDELKAREKVLVEALGTAQDELTHLSHHTREDYARDCVNKIFNSIEQALANVNNAKKG